MNLTPNLPTKCKFNAFHPWPCAAKGTPAISETGMGPSLFAGCFSLWAMEDTRTQAGVHYWHMCIRVCARNLTPSRVCTVSNDIAMRGGPLLGIHPVRVYKLHGNECVMGMVVYYV